MVKDFLVINAQGHSIKNSGGVGRYLAEIYQGVTDSLNSNKSIKLGLIAENHSPAIGNSRFDNKLIIKAKRQLPSKFVDTLVGAREFFYSLKRKRSVPHSHTHGLIEEKNIKLYHEITNYSVGRRGGRIALNKDIHLLATFHDVQDLFFPENFSDQELTTRRLAYSFYKDRANTIFCVSDHTKNTLLERLAVPEEKIVVTKLGPGIRLASRDTPKATPLTHLGRYWIYPAKFWKHKNHRFLFQGIKANVEAFRRKKIKILLTGGFSRQDIKSLYTLSRDIGVSDIILVFGFVSEAELGALMSNAEYLIFPSAYEGFGMPILDAMNLGCPVLCSGTTALPEVGGAAPIYFNPHCLSEFSGVIENAILDRFNREKMISAGYERARLFSWDACVRATFDGYIKTLMI